MTTLPRRLFHIAAHFLKRARAVEPYGRDLRQANREKAVGGIRKFRGNH
jgi:hypothetical protein